MSQAYREAGVDIEAGTQAVEKMKGAVKATFNKNVLSDLGSFGGLFDLADVVKSEKPILVSSTDGVGTKVEVAKVMERWDTIGQCLVNHCINDILVQGAKPLFFLDFLGCHKLDPDVAANIVGGMAKACREQGTALLGGETAEMGDTYQEGSYEVAGTIVGVVEREQLLDGSTIKAGDIVLSLASTGLHTNGYTLARKLLADVDWKTWQLDGRPIGEHMLDVHRCYLKEIQSLREAGITIKGLAHITGGGIAGNFSRILPEGLGADLSLKPLSPPPIFALLQERGNLTFQDMLGAFNLGVGMLVVVSPEQSEEAKRHLPELTQLGTVSPGDSIVVKP